MSAPSNALFRQLQRIPQSIVFYPTVIPAGYFMLGGLVLLFETTDLAHAWRNMLPPGLAEADNAREILGTLITSIISLTVFSFSMVMVVLNGAASRLSPRVLPGLISDRRNQLILGNYLGCILFFLLMIAFINKNEPDSLPAFGVLLAVLMGLGCMALFVVFIRSISQSIQVDWIVGQLYRSACHNLAQRCERLGSITAAPDDRDAAICARSTSNACGSSWGRTICRRCYRWNPGSFWSKGIRCSRSAPNWMPGEPDRYSTASISTMKSSPAPTFSMACGR